jgi:hypothetical protein
MDVSSAAQMVAITAVSSNGPIAWCVLLHRAYFLPSRCRHPLGFERTGMVGDQAKPGKD